MKRDGLPRPVEIMAAVPGLTRRGADTRLYRYRQGKIELEDLFAPVGALVGKRRAGLPTTAEIMAATGLTWSGADSRLKRYSAGQISVLDLFAPQRWTTERDTGNQGTPEWQALGTKERRENLQNLPSPGTWEKQ